MKIENNPKRHIYEEQIHLVAQLKAQGTTPLTLEKQDPEAAAELNALFDLLNEENLMDVVDSLANEIKQKLHAIPTQTVLFPAPVTPGREPKKIPPPVWRTDPLPLMQIVSQNPTWKPYTSLRKALGSDASHETTEEVKRRRTAYGLPGTSVFSWKERLTPLTEYQLTALENMGFENARHIRPGTWAYEKMLMALFPSRR